MKKLLPLLVIIYCTFVSCKKSSESTRRPHFRVHNFSPGAPQLYITLDGWQNTGSPIGYLQYGGFGEYPYDNDGSQELKVYAPVSNATYLTKSVSMQDYYTYSIFTANIFTQMEYLMVPVFNDPSATYTNCRVRLINLCPNAGNVTAVMGQDTLFRNIPYLSASDYVEIPSGNRMTQIFSPSLGYVAADRGHDYNGLQVKDIVVSGFRNATDTSFAAKITVVQE